MSTKKEPQDDNEQPESELGSETEESGEAPPKITKKRKRKTKIVTEMEAETDEEKLIMEITQLLRRARLAIANKNFLEAMKCYQEAAVAANMTGDTDREKIYLNRANEILREHPELKEEGMKFIKKRKLKAKLREEEKFSLLKMIENLFIAGIMFVLVLSGLFAAVLLQELLETGGSYDIPLLWGLSIGVEIGGLVVAYLLGTRWLRWPE